MVFSSQNSTYSVLPFIDVGCLYAEDYGTPSKQLFVKLNVVGEALTIYRTKDVVDYIIQCSTLKNPFGLYEFTQKADLVTKLLMFENSKDLIPESASKVIKPLKTDPGLVLGNKMSKWRTPEYELYEWNRFEGVLFFDTKDYKVQRDFFRRLAFFVEKAGYRGRILSDEELGDMHGYNAHDYSAKSLAEFFTKTKQVNVKLTEKEHLLEEILVHNGVIVPDGNGYKEGRGAVISISQESQEFSGYKPDADRHQKLWQCISSPNGCLHKDDLRLFQTHNPIFRRASTPQAVPSFHHMPPYSFRLQYPCR